MLSLKEFTQNYDQTKDLSGKLINAQEEMQIMDNFYLSDLSIITETQTNLPPNLVVEEPSRGKRSSTK